MMYPMGSWAGTTKVNFNVGVFPLPGATSAPTLGLNYGQALYVSAKTKYPAAARAFAVALGTGQGPNLAQLNSDSLIPVVKGFSIPSSTAPLIKDTVAAYRTQGATYVDPFEWTQGADALPSGFSTIFDKGAQGVLLGGDVKSFLSDMDTQYKTLNH
jgi:ABC-type glycerol-3-phosphate transport system substrate-binding protein